MVRELGIQLGERGFQLRVGGHAGADRVLEACSDVGQRGSFSPDAG